MKMKIIINKCSSEEEFASAKSVRKQVFVAEQGINEAIEGSDDNKCDHFVAYLNNEPVGAARINYPKNGVAKIERMAVLSKVRSAGIGGKILESMIEYLESKSEISDIILDAQSHAKGFYEKFGFNQDGEIFEEVGIPHIKMKKRFGYSPKRRKISDER
jgi:predicted GNAT family N-acyltransferase